MRSRSGRPLVISASRDGVSSAAVTSCSTSSGMIADQPRACVVRSQAASHGRARSSSSRRANTMGFVTARQALVQDASPRRRRQTGHHRDVRSRLAVAGAHRASAARRRRRPLGHPTPALRDQPCRDEPAGGPRVPARGRGALGSGRHAPRPQPGDPVQPHGERRRGRCADRAAAERRVPGLVPEALRPARRSPPPARMSPPTRRARPRRTENTPDRRSAPEPGSRSCGWQPRR